MDNKPRWGAKYIVTKLWKMSDNDVHNFHLYIFLGLSISLVFMHATHLWLNTSSPTSSSSGRSELIRWSKVYYNGAVIAVLRSVCRYMCRFVIPITLSLSIYIYRVLLIAHAYLLEGILIVKYIVELPYSIEHNNG